MPAERSWEIAEPQTLDFGEPVDELHVRIVSGAVNVVGAGRPAAGCVARVEIGELHGPPLTVRRQGGRLVVAYDDLPWRGFLKWLDGKGRRREAVVSVSVPAGVRVSVGVVGASAVVSGIRGRTDIRGVSGDTTLVGLAGDVRAETVSGSVETQSLSGALRMNSVSGDLTVIDGGGSRVRADSVNGDMILDLDTSARTADIGVTTVSGEVAVRLPHTADATVEAVTTSGAVSSAFEELRTEHRPGAKRVTGTLGTGSGALRATTVSGALALLRRPHRDDGGDGGASGGADGGSAGSPPDSLRKDI